MKVGKKLLSVFLAVIMIMSSMSVCFGCVTFASAADDTNAVKAFVAAMKCDAMKSFSTSYVESTKNSGASKEVTNTFTYTAPSYAYYEQVVNVVTKLDLAVKGLDEYKNAHNHNNGGNCQDGWGKTSATDKCTDLGWIERHLKSAIGDAELATLNNTYNFANLCNAIFNMDDCEWRNADNDLDGDDTTSTSNVEARVHNVLLVKVETAMDKLTSYSSISAIPDTLNSAFQYKLSMCRQNYQTGRVFKTNHYHHALNTKNGDATNPAPATTGATISTNKAALVTAENTLNANAYYNAADVAAVLSLSSNNVETLKTAKTTLEGVKTAVNNDAVFNHFFGTKYNKAIKNIEEAIVVLGYKDTVDAIKEYYAVDFMRMNKDEVKAHLDAFNAAYGTFTALSDSAKATIVSNYGLDTAAVEAKIQEVQNRYDYLCVIELKNEADGYIADYQNWTIDNVDDGSVTSAMLTVAAANLIRVIAGLEAYDKALVAAVAGADYINNLKALKADIDNLGKAAGYNDSFLAEYAEFTARIEAVTSKNSTTLFNALAYYDSWYTDLKALISTMYTELGATDAEKLFDDLNKTMVAHMNDAYKELNTRTEVQINVAYDLYDAHKAVYGATVHYVSLESYYILRDSIGLIDTNAYNFLNNSGNFTVPAETVKKYDELQNILVKYNDFVATKGFGTYETLEIDDITREKSDEEIFRDKDYTVTDELVLDIIDTLEAALADPEIKAILGKLINKKTGEPFDIAALLSGLISDGLFSDSLINTIIQFIYPAVANIFTEVWMGIDPKIDDPNMEIAEGMNAKVYVDLYLKTVEEATEGLNLPIFPTTLAKTINSKYSQFSNVATLLAKATTPSTVKKDADGNWDESTRKSPWNDAVLYTDKVDAEGNVIKNEETGETTKVLALDWGVDELEGDAKRERFLQAIQAALIGLEPILLALLCNKEMNQTNPLIGTGEGDLSGLYVDGIPVIGSITLNGAELDVHTINLVLKATANDGYNNVIAPLFELLLGVKAPDGKTFGSTRAVIEKGLLEPLDAVIAKLAANPIETILEILPNLTYAIEADLLLSKLDYLSTNINYSASAIINADLTTCDGVGFALKYLDGIIEDKTGFDCTKGVISNVPVNDVVADALPVAISTFLDINALLGEGVDLSSFDGIWNLISGLLGEGLELPAPNAAYIAMLGELTEIDTVRSIKSYNWGTPGKAAHIVANKADVLIYLVKYALESGLLGALVANPNELVNTLFTNLATNSEDAIAAIAELLNQETVYDAKKYSWFNGSVNGSSVVGNSANAIYLNPGNDWTEAKAEYLYENLESLIATILTLAKVDLDKNTPEAETLDQFIGGKIDGLLGDKTLTALAGALGKLDLNALLAPKADAEAGEGENTTTPDASEPETVAEGEDATEGEEGEEETEAAAPALDVEALINSLLGIDLSTFRTKYGAIAEALEADETYVYNFGVDEGTKTFAAALAEIIAPFEDVINFILVGGNLEIKLGTETVTLLGSNGYNNAIIPLLEALGCDVTAFAALGETTALEATINALLAKLEALTDGHFIKNVIDLIPGLLYFIASNGLSTTVLNLLQPVLVIVDTINPIIDVIDVIGNIEIGEEGAKQKLVDLLGVEKLDLEHLDVNFVVGLVKALTGLDLTGLENVIYDVVYSIGSTTYTSKSTLQTEWKKAAAYSEATFDQADMLTVLLSFVLEWATVEENAEALDTLLKTEGLIASITAALAGVDINYADPDWMYWFETEEEFNAYVNGSVALPDTLLALDYPNDWNEATAKAIAAQLPDLVDMVIGLINAEKGEDAPKTLSALLNGLIGEYMNAETMEELVALIANLLSGIDATLIETAGVLLDANIAGLSTYTCEAEITDIESFVAELARVLDTYAGRVVEWIFFGEAYEFARKSTGASTIVINGGNGYEEGLALILEALGAEVPDPATATTASALGALATRVEAILANPVAEILDLLPNLIYFLNANGAGVAVSNILAPVVSLIDALAIEGVKLDLAELIKIEKKDADGNKIGEVKLNLGALTLENIVNFVEELTGLNLVAVENILVDFCVGKIVKTNYGYKMVADRDDVVTILLTTALSVVNTEGNDAVIDELIGQEIIGKIKAVFESSAVNYVSPEWYALDWNDVDYEKQAIGVVQSAISYPNDWSAEASLYIADNLGDLVDKVIALINNGKEDAPKTLAALIEANVNIYTPDLLEMIQTALGDLLGGLEGDLAELVNVGLGIADSLLGADVQGLLDYDVSEVNDKASFVAALTGMLMEVEGLVDWLLFSGDYKFFVDDKNNNNIYDAGEDIVTLNGAEGYAQGLSLILEALGVAAPAVVKDENGVVNTEATVSAVLTAVFDRVDAVLADPVDEAMNMLPNIIYFINANGLAAAVNNLAGAFNTLALKLEAFGLNIALNDLVNIEKMLKIEKDLAISLDNLTLAAVLELVAELTGLDLSKVADIFVGFALGKVEAYEGVNGSYNLRMVYDEGEAGRFNKGDMITLIVTAALRVIDNEDNAAVLDELIGTEIISALKTVFAGGSITYSEINWNYAADNDGEYMLQYPNNWNEDTAIAVTDVLLNGDIQALIAGLIDEKYDSLGALLTDKVNVFTTENLQAVVNLIADLLKDIDSGLLKAAGLILGVDVAGLKGYKAPAGITTVKAFAAELANVLSTYAPGVVEWLLLGKDYKFFVKDDANGITVDAITISGANGYTEGLAVLLEALGVAAPAVIVKDGVVDTEATVAAVLGAVADRINEIFANPVEEVINLLPNVIYFLNTDGVAVVVDNTLAALTALLGKLETFGLKVDINSLVDLPKLMGVADKYKEGDDVISLDNITISSLLTAVSYMIEDLDLTVIEKVLVGFDLGETAHYTTLSATEAGKAMKMTCDAHDTVTIIANLLLITIADEDNAEFLKELMGEEIYGMIMELFDMTMLDVQDFSWMYTSEETGGNKVGETFTTLETSEEYEDWPMYGPFYTEEMATYIAENFGMFVDNILYLLGLEVNGITVDNLTDLINGLLDGSLYTADNVIKIRDALAGVLANLENLEVNGKKVGGHIINVLKAAKVADLRAVGAVQVAAFNEEATEREQFVAALCDVLEPLYPVLKYLLAKENFTFFVDEAGKDLITLKGAEGYAYGILPLLEALDCQGILAPAAYYDAVKADGDVIITSILNPLLDRVDEIIADPANEILEILPNIIYFINSNGVDTVVKNTLNAVYSLLKVIEPIAKIDLYELIGIDFSTINMNWLLDQLVELLAGLGYEFTREAIDPIAELTVGTLEGYTSLNGKQAYKMVYATSDAEGAVVSGGKEELVSVILRLGISFLMHEKNAEILVDLLVNELGMTDAKDYLTRLIKSIAAVPTTTYLGMNQAQAVVYYLFYSADIGAGEAAGGLKDINAEWQIILKELSVSDDPNEQTIGSILKDLMNSLDTEDVLGEEGVAPNGLIKFFQKIIDWFNKIIEWFKNLFN